MREGKYDVLVGTNLLREGLDIPEVSLIAIFDADKEGFLRSTRSLIQVIGRAARNANGRVIMYADGESDAMREAISETLRRRTIQMAYNEENGIIPTTVKKEIRAPIRNMEEASHSFLTKDGKINRRALQSQIEDLEKQMRAAAKMYDFERAAELRDLMFEAKAMLEEQK